MNVTFSEKSAWGSLLALALVAYWYFPRAFAVASSGDEPVKLVVLSIICTVVLILVEVVYHVIIASNGRSSSDERDALFDLKASRNAGFVLGFGLFSLVGHIILSSIPESVPRLGTLSIAVWILLAVTVSEIAKLGFQIYYYRAGC